MSPGHARRSLQPSWRSKRASNSRRERMGVSGRHEKVVAPVLEELRCAGVSLVISGVAVASAWNALLGMTRLALSEVPKIPSAHPAER